MSIRIDNKDIPVEKIAEELNQTLDQLDPLRTEGLRRLYRTRQVKDVQLQREHKRLQVKLGERHPRVLETKERLKVNKDLQRDLTYGISRAETPFVNPEPDAWILHGHVRGPDLKGLAGLTVSLYNDNNQRIKKLGYACTNETGYFQIRYQLVKQGHPGVPGGEASGTVEGLEKIPPVMIHVNDSQGATIFIDDHPLNVKAGGLDYRQIILKPAAPVCRPPEAGVQTGNGKEGR